MYAIIYLVITFFTGATAISFAFFGQGTGAIWLDNVVCTGNETRLYDCQNTGIGVHNCSHFEDVGIRCLTECKKRTSTTQLCLCLPILSKEYVHSLIQIYQCISIVVCQGGQIRLSGGRNSAEGRVEICFNNQWGTVCDDFWSTSDGNVVCRQLGFSPNGINIIHTFAIYLYELASH